MKRWQTSYGQGTPCISNKLGKSAINGLLVPLMSTWTPVKMHVKCIPRYSLSPQLITYQYNVSCAILDHQDLCLLNNKSKLMMKKVCLKSQLNANQCISGTVGVKSLSPVNMILPFIDIQCILTQHTTLLFI